MKLLTKEIEKRFTEVGNQENLEDPIVVAKFFNPTGAGTWFATEYDPEEKEFFGYVSLFNDHNAGPIFLILEHMQRHATVEGASAWKRAFEPVPHFLNAIRFGLKFDYDLAAHGRFSLGMNGAITQASVACQT